jgi:sulfoxide reductase heme-binding subunit YedZ
VADLQRQVLKPAVFLAALAPLLLLLIGAGGIAGRTLGADPVAHVLDTCGKTALNLLLLTLTVTPARQLTGWSVLQRYRRMLGLFAFFYACLHLLAYVLLDLGLDFGHLWQDILKRPFITIGFAAVVLLVPLALTSTQRMMRRLGRRWQTLHMLIYPIAMLGVWHYYWQVKADIREPLVYVTILAVLLGYRLWRRWRRTTSRSGSATVPGRT